jgi:signal transduction histidine kinase
VNRGSQHRRALALDAVLCLALLAAGVPPTMQSGKIGAGTALDTVLLPTLIVPILLRRRSPVLAAGAFAAGSVVSAIPTFDQFRVIVAVPVAALIVYQLARDSEPRHPIRGLLLIAAGLAFVGATDATLEGVAGEGRMMLFSLPLIVCSWVGGRLVRSRERLIAQLAERSALLVRRREETAGLAVDVERARLAADLDAAARLRVQAIAARALVGSDDAVAARDAFAAIEHLGRDSLDEMRALLGVLRSDAGGGYG